MRERRPRRSAGVLLLLPVIGVVAIDVIHSPAERAGLRYLVGE